MGRSDILAAPIAKVFPLTLISQGFVCLNLFLCGMGIPVIRNNPYDCFIYDFSAELLTDLYVSFEVLQ